MRSLTKIRLILLILLGASVLACDSSERDADGTTAPSNSVPDATSGTASQPRPEWLPDAIALPADFSQLADRSIGSYTRILQGQTAADQNPLLAELREALSAAGYQVDDRADLVEQGLVRYQGNGLQEASIRFVDAVDRPDGLIQFDARLDEW